MTAMCDVSCKFWEAARIFAPQKGADPAMTQALERNLLALQPQLGQAAQAPGSGAAGGFGAAVTAFSAAVCAPGSSWRWTLRGLTGRWRARRW